jgi:hypothetical protein
MRSGRDAVQHACSAFRSRAFLRPCEHADAPCLLPMHNISCSRLERSDQEWRVHARGVEQGPSYSCSPLFLLLRYSSLSGRKAAQASFRARGRKLVVRGKGRECCPLGRVPAGGTSEPKLKQQQRFMAQKLKLSRNQHPKRVLIHLCRLSLSSSFFSHEARSHPRRTAKRRPCLPDLCFCSSPRRRLEEGAPQGRRCGELP